ncbi:ABC transporter ATP-binding protein [Pseudohaliea rubra]|uniref:Lipoprotein releasing system ATP-binding protein LolD n=1 Tax=Pseudohaliea rubra DSM 19751 TaxID=1265313 RepID=A0A095WXK5_9GAMM|nr:ATP-binding cassette domain-containing protein [Pseudohaliea rubra]KGE03359.1 Lipoprotein releasing system ATP-binding protein LolD [Pseudohaliea rubra DSM 19751]
MAEPVLRCRGLGKVYRDGSREVEVLRNVELTLDAGERLAIVGASGSGKSTLLNLLGGLDPPSSGSVEVAGQSVDGMSEKARCRWRNRHLGFVYQFHHLLAEFDAAENVAMPLLIGGVARSEALKRAGEMLERVGLGARLDHRPAALSGGERQRVAIARALVASPGCVLMDEPTGNLDPASAERVLALIDDLGREQAAFIIVTHDPAIAARMHRTLVLEEGHLVEMHG